MYYLWIIIFVFALAIALSIPGESPFYKEIFRVIPAVLIPAAVFIIWDYFFSVWSVWGINKEFITGRFWFGIPLESVLFYVAIPYAGLLLYAYSKKFIEKDVLRLFNKSITGFFLIVTLFLFFIFRKQLYTSIVSLVCAFLLTIRAWVSRPKSLSRFYLAYFISLVPVLIIYFTLIALGVLWYDPAQILGIKIINVPVENILYFLALFLMNVAIYDYLKSRQSSVVSGQSVEVND